MAQPASFANPKLRRLIVFFLLLSTGLSVVILRCRNLFDDEILSVDFVTGSIRYILATSAEGDVHPAGMYLLAHVGWVLTRSFRWMNLVPLAVLYGGLAVFLLRVTPLLRDARSRVCFLALGTLHPQLLMWSNTFRWYCPWTGLALIVLVVALQPGRERPRLTYQRVVVVGALVAGLFYLSYITLLFAAALAVVAWWRFRAEPRGLRLRCAGLAVGVFVVLIALQLHTMVTVHLQNSAVQRTSLPVSCVRLVESLVASEAYLPWHPLAILAGVLFVGLVGFGVVRWMRGLRRHGEIGEPLEPLSGLASVIVFGVVFFVLLVISGLGGKPRNGLLLIPTLAPAVGLLFGRTRPFVRMAGAVVMSLWIVVGVAHLMARYGIAKSNMNDRPEQVVGFIEQDQRRQVADSRCGVVLTYDSGLAFTLNEARLPGVQIVAPFGSPFLGLLTALPSHGCGHPRLYAVESYVGDSYLSPYTREPLMAVRYMQGVPGLDRFSYDPDAARKRSLARLPGLASGANLPDDRFVVISGTIDRESLPEIHREMRHFTGEGKDNDAP